MSTCVFITGTGTEVGKTVLTAQLVRHLRESGVNALAIKPLCSGGRGDAELLQTAQSGALTLDEINPWHYPSPVTPFVAGREIGNPARLPEVIRQRRMDYYRHMASGTGPSVTVVEDLDFPHCIGAYWGEINTTVHKGFGMAGALTNGVMRDLGDCPEGFPVVAGSIGPSHGFVHVKEIGTPVEIFSMTVNDGDLVHADRHGALVIPADVIDQLEAAILKLLETEKIVLEAARKDGFTFEDFAEAWAAFEKSRT